MRCRGMVVGTAPDRWGHIPRSVCKKTARVFFRVQFKNVNRYSVVPPDGEVIGFCLDHSEGKHDPKAYTAGWRAGLVYRCPGDGLEVKSANESEAKESRSDREHELIKMDFKKMFGLKRNKGVSIEEWKEIFQDSLDEYSIELVMKS